MTTTTRRAMLAGPAATIAAPTVAVASQLAPDPIFAAIEEHEAAYHLNCETSDRQAALGEELPRWRMQSDVFVYACLNKVVATDDPRWIALARDVPMTAHRYDAAEWALAETTPTTAAGLRALLMYLAKHYAREIVRLGEGVQDEIFPERRLGHTPDEDADEGAYINRLLANLGRAAELIGVQS